MLVQESVTVSLATALFGQFMLVNIEVFSAGEEDAVAGGWSMVEPPMLTVRLDGGGAVQLPLLPPRPSEPDEVEHWTRAMFTDAAAGPPPPGGAAGSGGPAAPAMLGAMNLVANVSSGLGQVYRSGLSRWASGGSSGSGGSGGGAGPSPQ